MISVIGNEHFMYTKNDEDEYQFLNSAIEKELFEIAQLLINCDYPVNKLNTDERHNTPLHNAVLCNNFNVTMLLLHKRALQDVKNSDGYPSLHLAYRKGYHRITNLLLRWSECFYIVDDYNLSNLHIACALGKLQVAKRILVKYDAEINKTVTTDSSEWSGYTPLHFAIESSKLRLVKWLLTKGVNINAADSNNSRPLHLAFRNKDFSLLKILSSHPDITSGNCTDRYNLSYLHIFSALNLDKNIRTLLENKNIKVNVNACVSNDDPSFAGYTALHFTVHNNARKVAKILLLKSASYTISNASGFTALHQAFLSDKQQFVKLFLKFTRLLNKNSIDNSGISHFHILCASGPSDVIKDMVFENSVDINASVHNKLNNFLGFTALHFAVENERTTVVDKLLELKADPNIMNFYGLTPLHLACRINILKFSDLMKKGKDSAMLILEEFLERKKYMIKSLLDHKADVNIKDNNSGKTPLLYLNSKTSLIFSITSSAALEKNEVNCLLIDWKVNIVKEFKSHGANLNAVDHAGRTFLHSLLYTHRTFCESCLQKVDAMIGMGFDVNTKTKTGETSILTASSYQNSDEIIGLLLKHGADPNVVDKYQKSLLHRYALKFDLRKKFGRRNFSLEELLKRGADLNHQLKNGKNVLHNIFSKKTVTRVAFCRVVLSVFPFYDLNIQDAKDRTPLHYACFKHNMRDVEFLLRQGADIDVFDCEGKTPFNCCLKINCAAAQAVLYHVEKIQKLGCFLSKENREAIEMIKTLNPTKKDIFSKDEESKELDRLRKVKIDQYTNMYDILHKSSSKLTLFIRNPVFRKHIACKKFDSSYPIYGELVKRQFRRGLNRSSVLVAAKKALAILSNFSIPDNCNEHIIDFLDGRSIQRLILATQIYTY